MNDVPLDLEKRLFRLEREQTIASFRAMQQQNEYSVLFAIVQFGVAVCAVLYGLTEAGLVSASAFNPDSAVSSIAMFLIAATLLINVSRSIYQVLVDRRSSSSLPAIEPTE